MIAFVDGRFVSSDDAVVSIHDRGLLHGDGVFETALLFHGGFFRLRAHLERFAASAATMRLPHADLAEIEGVVRRLAQLSRLDHGQLRITLTRGVTAPGIIITIKAADPSWAERARSGWTLITARTRRPSIAAVPAQLKALGRVYALLARQEAQDAGADDALLLTDAGDVCEGPAWNVFWRRDRTLFTPAADAGVLSGVTRAVLADIAPELGFSFEEGLFPRAALDDADEIFATMTSVGIVPIRRLDERTLPPETSAADALFPRYWQVVESECAADRVAHAS